MKLILTQAALAAMRSTVAQAAVPPPRQQARHPPSSRYRLRHRWSRPGAAGGLTTPPLTPATDAAPTIASVTPEPNAGALPG